MERPVSVGRKKRKPAAKKTTTTRKRRRVSGMNLGGGFMDVVMVAGGAVGGRILGNMINKAMPGTNLYLINGGVGAVGYMLPKFVKAPWAKNVGLGMIATAAVGVAVNSGMIAGTGNRMAYQLQNNRRMNGGLSNLPAINGLDNLAAVNGRKMRVAGVYNTGVINETVAKMFAMRNGYAA